MYLYSLYSWSLPVVAVTSIFPVPCVYICLLWYWSHSCINHLSVLYILKHTLVCSYPTLEAKGREQLAPNHFLGQLENPQVAFSVKQKRPKTLEEAVTATLEMESYLGPKAAGTAELLAL